MQVDTTRRMMTRPANASATLPQAEQELERLFSLLDRIPGTAIQAYTPDGRVVFWNRQSEQLYGWNRREALGQQLADLLMQSTDATKFASTIADAIKNGSEIESGTYQLRTRHGPLVTVHSSHAYIHLVDGRTILFCMDIDLTELSSAKERAERAQRRLAYLLEASGENLWDWHIADGMISYNRQWCRMMGLDEKQRQYPFDTFLSLLHPDDRARVEQALQVSLADDAAAYEIEYRVCTRDGQIRWVRDRGRVVKRGADGSALRMLGMLSDISARHQSEDEIRELAFYDPLTALPNRRLFIDRLSHSMAASSRSGQQGALLFLDLDGFKAINDNYGHGGGDALLRQVAERLSRHVRSSDTVARFGGDEFVILLDLLSADDDEASRQASRLAEALRQHLCQPFQLEQDSVSISTSIGICQFQGEKETAQTLLMQADMALYQAKNAGRNAWHFFDAAMQSRMEAREQQEAALRHALARQEMRLDYQWQVNAATEVQGAEARIVWQRADGRALASAEFWPLAEESGHSVAIGKWMLAEGCRQLQAWASDPRRRRWQLTLRIGARHFRQQDFVAHTLALISASGTDPGRLTLALDETVLQDKLADSADKMQALHAAGVSFALADFGAGAASLQSLQQLPFATIQIAPVLIGRLQDKHADTRMTRAIIAICRTLGLQAVATGVSHEQQYLLLLSYACPVFQGELFAGAGDS